MNGLMAIIVIVAIIWGLCAWAKSGTGL